MIRFLKRRACERSTYAHLVTCIAAAVTAAGAIGQSVPRGWFLVLVALSVAGALMPDGKIKPKEPAEPAE
jgi:hypothetical protein